MRSGLDAPVRAALEEAVAALGAAGGDRRDPRRRRRADRRRRSGRAGADRAPPDGRRLPGARPAAPAHRARTTARCRRDRRGTDQRTVIVGGDAILCAARVEPLVEPGQIWATEDFRQQFLERPSLWRTTAGAGARRRRPLQHQEAGLARARRLDVPLPARVLSARSRRRRARSAPRRSARGSTTSAIESIAVGWSLTMTTPRTGARRDRHHARHRLHLQRRADREQQVGLGGGGQRAVDDLGHERLAERDRVALQDAAADRGNADRPRRRARARAPLPSARAGRIAST